MLSGRRYNWPSGGNWRCAEIVPVAVHITNVTCLYTAGMTACTVISCRLSIIKAVVHYVDSSSSYDDAGWYVAVRVPFLYITYALCD